ncbi:unnamed protein product [Paramecium primaurelia]|uniref:Uncharacterized protein n=1 Tax=Paramecium primaurelia TaxID=5886 RepID=A0A8S1NQ58_PARPR|nr:unnamed protein product [Paramecium primaurelia]
MKTQIIIHSNFNKMIQHLNLQQTVHLQFLFGQFNSDIHCFKKDYKLFTSN